MFTTIVYLLVYSVSAYAQDMTFSWLLWCERVGHNQWGDGWTATALPADGRLQRRVCQKVLWRRGRSGIVDRSHGVFLWN